MWRETNYGLFEYFESWLLCISTSSWVLRAPKSWFTYFFPAVFNLFCSFWTYSNWSFASSLSHSYTFPLLPTTATPLFPSAHADTPLQTSPSQLHSRPPPGQHYPWKNCTIGKNLTIDHPWFMSPQTHQNKTGYIQIINKPQIVYALYLLNIMWLRYYYLKHTKRR